MDQFGGIFLLDLIQLGFDTEFFGTDLFELGIFLASDILLVGVYDGEFWLDASTLDEPANLARLAFGYVIH